MDTLKCQLVEKVSEKGKSYVVLEIDLTPTYKKIVFLDKAELELIKLFLNMKKN